MRADSLSLWERFYPRVRGALPLIRTPHPPLRAGLIHSQRERRTFAKGEALRVEAAA